MKSAFKITASAGSSKPRRLPEPGPSLGTVVQIIDIGTQTSVFNGEEKQQRKVRWVFELPEQLTKDDEGNDRPLLIAKEFTNSTHEKATQSKLIEALRGKPLGDEDRNDYDITQHLGATALLSIEHKNRPSGGGQYAAIGSAMALPKNSKKPAKYGKPLAWGVELGRDETFNAFPDWLKDKIEASAEFVQMGGSARPFEDGDDVPF